MTQVWLLVPNLIGYLRLALLLAFFLAVNPLLKVTAITLSLLLDVLDGKVARWLNQTSLFGSRFDLLIDMVTLASLSFYVAYHCQNPWGTALFILGGLNDTVSYLLSLKTFYGKTRVDHKKFLQQKGFFLPLYYSPLGLALFNVLHDAFLIVQVYSPPFITPPILFIFLCGYLFRQLSNSEQIFRLSAQD